MSTSKHLLWLACLIAAMSTGSVTEAAVIFGMLHSPTTTAGGGATSTRSGPGTWHLYALDTDPASFGISSYNITMTGATAINHRAPVTTILDENGDPQTAGFNLLRTATNANPIQASQNLPGQTPFLLTGFGQTAGNFASKTSAIQPGSSVVGPTTSAAWGNYPNVNTFGFGLYGPGAWVFLAEGTGFAQISGSVATIFSNQSFVSVAASTQNVQVCLGCVPPQVQSAVINNVVANDPGSVAHTFLASNFNSEPVTWGGFSFVSGPTPATPATFDPATQKFNWSTLGSSIGTYKWAVQASTPTYGPSTGYITVNIAAVPEPATLTTMVLAIAGVLMFRRSSPTSRRN